MENKVIYKKKMKEFGGDPNEAIDFSGTEYDTTNFEGNDIDMLKKIMYRSFVKRGISGSRAEILVGTLMSLIGLMVDFKFNSKAMMVLNKAVDFIQKRLG